MKLGFQKAIFKAEKKREEKGPQNGETAPQLHQTMLTLSLWLGLWPQVMVTRKRKMNVAISHYSKCGRWAGAQQRHPVEA